MQGVGWLLGGAIENADAAAWWRRALVVIVAIVASYAVPAFAFTVAGLAGGNGVWSTEVTVAPDNPATAAGIMTGDRVVLVGGKPVTTFAELALALADHAGEPVEVVVVRSGEQVRLTMIPEGPSGRGRIGISARTTLKRGVLGSLVLRLLRVALVAASIAACGAPPVKSEPNGGALCPCSQATWDELGLGGPEVVVPTGRPPTPEAALAQLRHAPPALRRCAKTS